jgi:CDP-diglyceride synthetase
MLARLGIRAGTSLAGIAAGLVLASAVLDKFSLNATAVVEATLVFWVVHLVVGFVALKVLVREPSLALAGLLALGSTIVSLIIVNAVVSGLSINGLQTYVLATAIVWLATAIGDTVGRRMIRARRAER